jgi:hypothetical protein
MLALSLIIVTAAFLAGRFGFAYMYLVVCLLIMAGAVKRQLEKVCVHGRAPFLAIARPFQKP